MVIKKILLFITLALALSPVSGFTQEQATDVKITYETVPLKDTLKDIFKEGIAPLCISGLAAWGTTLASNYFHELGHAIPAHLLGGGSCPITLNLNPFNGAYTIINLNAMSKQSQIFSLLCGPLAGVASCWLFLKCSNIWNKYKKTQNIKKALWQGAKKTTFHGSHIPGLIVASIYSIWINLCQLVPGDGEVMINNKFIQYLNDGKLIQNIMCNGMTISTMQTIKPYWRLITQLAAASVTVYLAFKTVKNVSKKHMKKHTAMVQKFEKKQEAITVNEIEETL